MLAPLPHRDPPYISVTLKSSPQLFLKSPRIRVEILIRVSRRRHPRPQQEIGWTQEWPARQHQLPNCTAPMVPAQPQTQKQRLDLYNPLCWIQIQKIRPGRGTKGGRIRLLKQGLLPSGPRLELNRRSSSLDLLPRTNILLSVLLDKSAMFPLMFSSGNVTSGRWGPFCSSCLLVL